MLIKKFALWFGVLGLVATSCADPDLGPVLTFDIATKGAYIRLVQESSKLIDITNDQTITNSQYTYTVEFVDQNQGELVTDYIITLDYVDVTGANSKEDIEFRSFSASEFEDFPNGFKGLSDITVTATEAISAAGIQPGDVNPGDQFIFNGSVRTEDGNEYGFSNSSAAVRGTAFSGHFRFILPAACPSSLEGTYSFEGSNFWCGAGPLSGEVTIEASGGGVYGFDDWSLGAYDACYGGFVPAGWGELSFTDVCNEVAFTGFVDNYGDTWTFQSSVSGNDWTITWVNTYGEGGSAVITNPNGWPFVIVE